MRATDSARAWCWGAWGVVYLARDQRLQRPAVVKVLAPHLARNQNVRRRFVTEALIQGGIDHPNIVRATDLIESEWAPSRSSWTSWTGPSLEQHLVEMSGRISWARARTVLLPVMEAVHAAHEQGVVHRDLKPANYPPRSRSRPRWFPRSRTSASRSSSPTDTGHTRQGTVIGTPNYMPPEQLEGSAESRRACPTLYALGAIILELLTGQRPYFGDTEFCHRPPRVRRASPPHFEALRAVGAPIGLQALLRARNGARSCEPDWQRRRVGRCHPRARWRDRSASSATAADCDRGCRELRGWSPAHFATRKQRRRGRPGRAVDFRRASTRRHAKTTGGGWLSDSSLQLSRFLPRCSSSPRPGRTARLLPPAHLMERIEQAIAPEEREAAEPVALPVQK
jgi:serine/threonine protein kinase